MLFLGTEKFPDENEYNQYLNKHGGSSNAYTDMESTNYYFDCSADHLDGALDRFSQFFIAPLFTPTATDRELNAVNSEHEKNLQNVCGDPSSSPRRCAGWTIPFTSLVLAIWRRWERAPKRRALTFARNCWHFTNGTIPPTL